MIPLLLAISLAAAPGEPPPTVTAVDRSAYEAARSQAGTDPSAQVKLALWCESHGFPAERLRHLAQATLRDPGNAAARGLLGIVRFREEWSSPEKVARQVNSDRKYNDLIAEYHRRRDQTDGSADAQARLADWCEQNGLVDESHAHHAVVLRRDPDRKTSRLKLGYKRDGRRWVTPEQLLAEREEITLQKAADRQWKAKLTEWRGALDDRGDRRERAEIDLAAVSDRRAVPSIVAVFGRGNEADRARAVRMLGTIDAASSSRALAALAVFDPSAEIRRSATETLKQRDVREFAGPLVLMMRDPIRYEVRHVGGPGSPGALFVGGKQFNVQRMYAPPALDLSRVGLATNSWIDGSGFLVAERTIGAGLQNSDMDFYGNVQVAYPRVSQAEALNMLHAQSDTFDLVRQALGPGYERIVQSTFPDPARRSQFESSLQSQTAINPAERARFEARIRSQAAISPDGKVNVHRDGFWEMREQIPVGRMIAEAQQAALSAEQQLQQDVAAIEANNQQVRESNDRVGAVLSAVSGKSQATDSTGWQGWWVDQLGFRNDLMEPSSSVPTLVENVPLNYVPETGSQVVGTVTETRFNDFRAVSCFGAGTLVRTLDGSRPIETLRVGDRVLSQSVADGALSYQPVTKVHHNPPSPTFLVKLAGDTVVTSPFHRFWVAGRGWVMARDLTGSETLRLLGETRRIDAVEVGPVQPVFNLDVAGDHDFFAGKAAVLVHDNTLPETRLVPFDAPGAGGK